VKQPIAVRSFRSLAAADSQIFIGRTTSG